MLTENKVLDNLVQNGCIKAYEFDVLEDRNESWEGGYLVLEFPNGQKLKISPDFHIPHGCLDWVWENVKVESPKDSVEPIPPNIYYSLEADNFYLMPGRYGLGIEFYNRWYPRKSEFPESL